MSENELNQLLQNFRGCQHVFEKMRLVSLKYPKMSILNQKLVDGIKIITLNTQVHLQRPYNKTRKIERICGSIDLADINSTEQKVIFICLSCYRTSFSRIQNLLKKQEKQNTERKQRQNKQRQERERERRRINRQEEERLNALKSPQQRELQKWLLTQKEDRRRQREISEKKKISDRIDRQACKRRIKIFLIVILFFSPVVGVGIYAFLQMNK